jgi:predicted amino acid dehydrogenase
LPINVGLPSPYCIFGSFAEAIILDLEKRYENFSSGTGNIYPEKIDEIRTLGKRHGFVVSDFFWNGKKIEAEVIEKLKKADK